MKIAIVGAGFYGLRIANKIKSYNKQFDVIVFEKNNNVCLEAISNNQHRLHLGFHYPRSKETIKQCLETFRKFEIEFEDCVDNIDDNVYIIHKDSKVASEEYHAIMSEAGNYFDLMEEFDNKILKNKNQFISYYKTLEKKINLTKLRDRLLEESSNKQIEIKLNSNVETIYNNGEIIVNGEVMKFDYVINASYSNPSLLKEWKIETKSELCFMAILKPKFKSNKTLSFTICDGPFSSLYLADNGNYSISNVLKTPKFKSTKVDYLYSIKNSLTKEEIEQICNDLVDESEKYFNIRENFDIVDYYCSIKTKILNDHDDFRGTFYVKNKNCISIMSGKIQACLLIEDEIIKEMFT